MDSKLRGDEVATFMVYISSARSCERCGADFTAHGPRLECPAWAIDQKLNLLEEERHGKKASEEKN